MKFLRVLAASAVACGLAAGAAFAHGGLVPQPVRTAPALSDIQFRLPFGMSAERVRETLKRDGYEEIEITHLGILDAKAEACRRGTRYQVKLRVDGSYEYRNEVGKCRKTVSADEVDDILRKEGFRQIDVQDDGRLPYVANACRRGDRYSVRVSEYGEIEVGKRIGRCDEGDRDILSPRDLRRALRKDGFNRIKFTERSRQRFTVEACNAKDRRIRLRIDRRGRIRDREALGRCAARIAASDIPGMLRRDGFNRIEVVDDKPPRFRAEACDRDNNRIRVSISPWGDKVNERKIGDCAPPATVASLTEQLQKASPKFRGISVTEGKDHAFIATLCDDGQRRELYFNRWGKFDGKKDLGRCVSKRFSEVVDELRDRGFTDVQIYMEGCRRRGRKFRITLDEYGNRVEREIVGRCN